ncbi:MAG: hypothetical protein JSS75_10925 [Bacteroidetes bacterium]|nr:hypothetical protein [Bacteroidota bacterium]
MTTQNIIRKGDIVPHEINLCLGDTVGENAVTSVRVAYEIAKAQPERAVLFINAFQSSYKFDEACAEAVGPEFVGQARKTFALLHSRVGEVPSDHQAIMALLEDPRLNIGTVVINSWEFAAKDARTRERLLFLLLRWAAEMNVTVIVFAQQLGSRQVTAGRYERGWMGKLMGIVARVVRFTREEQLRGDTYRLVMLDRAGEDAKRLDDSDEKSAEREKYVGKYVDDGDGYGESYRRGVGVHLDDDGADDEGTDESEHEYEDQYDEEHVRRSVYSEALAA